MAASNQGSRHLSPVTQDAAEQRQGPRLEAQASHVRRVPGPRFLFLMPIVHGWAAGGAIKLGRLSLGQPITTRRQLGDWKTFGGHLGDIWDIWDTWDIGQWTRTVDSGHWTPGHWDIVFWANSRGDKAAAYSAVSARTRPSGSPWRAAGCGSHISISPAMLLEPGPSLAASTFLATDAYNAIRTGQERRSPGDQRNGWSRGPQPAGPIGGGRCAELGYQHAASGCAVSSRPPGLSHGWLFFEQTWTARLYMQPPYSVRHLHPEVPACLPTLFNASFLRRPGLLPSLLQTCVAPSFRLTLWCA
ncbi:hypothetical protein CDD82_1494 [Ophiocordyceps australis]|uniref:Uncharacterized protein n=1 Tax=Ophiocordyceps australis TaxID=1399860 RepID=A0A2C5ZLD9_9HYPO|nr:hypothetical protein CDD82_1494 [Ophiocordyceps australis]